VAHDEHAGQVIHEGHLGQLGQEVHAGHAGQAVHMGALEPLMLGKSDGRELSNSEGKPEGR